MESEFPIKFETKEEANNRRLEEALARTPHERFLFFLKMIEEMRFFKTVNSDTETAKNNFVIE